MTNKFKKNTKNKGFVEIFGIHAVLAALKNSKRIHEKLIISPNQEDKFKNLKHKVNKIIFLPNSKFNKIYGNEKSHQGVILKTSKLEQPSIDEIISKSKKNNNEVVLMLDHITDPQNIGSIMRSCALLNCFSIIVAKNKAPDVTASMAKAASGALEIVNYIKVINLSRVIKQFKNNNFWVVGFDNNFIDANSNLKLPKKCLLIFGSENKGLRELTRKDCDQIIKIPINTNNHYGVDSLNVANACTIALYEYFKINK